MMCVYVVCVCVCAYAYVMCGCRCLSIHNNFCSITGMLKSMRKCLNQSMKVHGSLCVALTVQSWNSSVSAGYILLL